MRVRSRHDVADPISQSQVLLLQAPARLIASNAGVEGDVIIERLLGQPWELGYNAMDDKIEDLLQAGIIDPAKVSPPPPAASSSIASHVFIAAIEIAPPEKRKPRGKQQKRLTCSGATHLHCWTRCWTRSMWTQSSARDNHIPVLAGSHACRSHCHLTSELLQKLS